MSHLIPGPSASEEAERANDFAEVSREYALHGDVVQAARCRNAAMAHALTAIALHLTTPTFHPLGMRTGVSTLQVRR